MTTAAGQGLGADAPRARMPNRVARTAPRVVPLRRAAVPPVVDELFPQGSNTVACIVARNEARAIAAAAPGARATVARSLSTLVGPLLQARKIQAEAIRTERRRLSEALEAMPGSIGSWGWGDVDRRTLEPSFASVNLSIDTDRLGECTRKVVGAVGLRALVVEADRRSLGLAWWPMPLTWRQNVADRLLERSPTKHTPHAHIAARLAATAGLVGAMATAARAFDPDLQVAIPMAGGLLLGSVDVPEAPTPDAGDVNDFGFDAGTTLRGRRDLEATWWTRAGIVGRGARWTGLTFVGPFDDESYHAYVRAFEAANAGQPTAAVRIHACLGVDARRAPAFAARVGAVAPIDGQVAGALVGMALRTGIAGIRPECRTGTPARGARPTPATDPVRAAFAIAAADARRRGVDARLRPTGEREVPAYEEAMRLFGSHGGAGATLPGLDAGRGAAPPLFGRGARGA